MVTGRLRQRTWDTPEGDKRSVMGLQPATHGQGDLLLVSQGRLGQAEGGGQRFRC
jgi:single-stranded DNA-binding protein